MAKLSPIGNNAQFIGGVPASGAKLFFYAAGSSTKQTTYTDEAGLVPQTNPIILDSRGEPSQPIWLTEGLSYKVVFASSTDSDPPVSPIWDIDNVTGINDASLTIDQWVNSGVTPLYVSATQFTLSGDQTSAFQVNRRVKLLVTAGTVYGYITASVFGALTTVTVSLDSGVLDSGLSNVQLGLITPNNTSIRIISSMIADSSVTSGKLNDLSVTTGKLANDSITAEKLADSSQGGALINGYINVPAPSGNSLTINIKTKAGTDPSATDPVLVVFRNSSLTTSGYVVRSITAATSITISSGSTLGSTNAILARIAVLVLDNAGTVELAVNNLSGGVQLDETNLISTTAEGGAGAADSATVIYSTTARSSVVYRVAGFLDSTQATAGTYVTAPSLVQNCFGQALASMSSLGYGQTWQDVKASRALATTYYNTTGKPISVNVSVTSTAGSTISATVNGIAIQGMSQTGTGVQIAMNFLVPPGGSYSVANSGGTPTIANWAELR